MLAHRLRAERKQRGWTLDDLAVRAGVSKSLLSKIERDQVSPSLRTMKTLATALEIPLAWLLQEEDHLEQLIVRQNQRQPFQVPGSEIRREVIAPAIMRQLTLLIAYFEPGQSSYREPDVHLGEECVLVLKGRLAAIVGGQSTVLDEGDTLYFDARVPHLFRNDSAEPAQVLAALMYPPGPPRHLVDGRAPSPLARHPIPGYPLTSGGSPGPSNSRPVFSRPNAVDDE